MSNKNMRIFKILSDTIVAGQETDWDTIKAAVDKKEKITNYFTEVRSVVQWMLNEGIIERVNNPYDEKYVRKN